MKIKVKSKSKHKLSLYATKASAGMDLRANLEKEMVINPLERVLLPACLFLTLVNLSNENFVIRDGEKICQMVIAKQEKAEREMVETLLESDRGSGWFGQTGKS